MESLCAAPRLAGARTSVAAPLCTPSRQRDGRTVARAAAAAAAPPRSSTSPRRRHRRRCRQPSSGRDSGWGSPSADTLDWPASSGDSEDEDAELDLFPEEVSSVRSDVVPADGGAAPAAWPASSSVARTGMHPLWELVQRLPTLS